MTDPLKNPALRSIRIQVVMPQSRTASVSQDAITIALFMGAAAACQAIGIPAGVAFFLLIVLLYLFAGMMRALFIKAGLLHFRVMDAEEFAIFSECMAKTLRQKEEEEERNPEND